MCDKGYAGTEFARTVAERYRAVILRPNRKTEPGRGPHLAPIRQCIESIFWTLKDRLGLERHNARTLHGLRARITAKLLALAASVWLNHNLGRPTRALADTRRLTNRGINHLVPAHRWAAGGAAVRHGPDGFDQPLMPPSIESLWDVTIALSSAAR